MSSIIISAGGRILPAEPSTTPRLPDAPPPDGVYSDMSAEEYHRADAANASTLKKFFRSGHHGAHYLNGEPDDPSTAMLFGTALHARVLEPDLFHRDAIDTDLADSCVYHKHAKAEAENPGKIILHKGWRERIEAAARAIEKHRIAGALVRKESVQRELSIFWTEAVDIDGNAAQIRCKARLDMFDGLDPVDP